MLRQLALNGDTTVQPLIIEAADDLSDTAYQARLIVGHAAASGGRGQPEGAALLR